MPIVESFLGRHDNLNHPRQYLQLVNTQSRKVPILHGLGGIGKSQLAIRYAIDHKYGFTSISWLNCKDRLELLQSSSSSLSRLPEKSQNKEAINAEEVKKRARDDLQWLALDGNPRWLVKSDKIDHYSSNNNSAADETNDVGDFFTIADHGFILNSSRLQSSTELGKPFMRQTGTSVIEYLPYYQASDPDIATLDNNPLLVRKAPDFSLPRPREYHTVRWICSLDTEYAAAKAMLDEGEDDPLSYQAHETSYSHTKNIHWFLDRSKFQAWNSESDRNLLWASGKPGCGKRLIRCDFPRLSHHTALSTFTCGSIGNTSINIEVAKSSDLRCERKMKHGAPEAFECLVRRRDRVRHHIVGADQNFREILRPHIEPFPNLCKSPSSDHSSENWSLIPKCLDEYKELLCNRPIREPFSTSSRSRLKAGSVLRPIRYLLEGCKQSSLATQNDQLCFEMQAVGLDDNIPCLVIRGIFNYADSQRNTIQQHDAAMAWTILARGQVYRIIPRLVTQEPKITEVLEEGDSH